MNLSLRQKVFFISIVIFSIRFFIGSTVAFASVPLGNVWTDATLDPSILYTVDGTATVEPSITLTVPAGTHFIFTPGSHLDVKGNLNMDGTAADHVTIDAGPIPPLIPFAAPTTPIQPQSQSPQVLPVGSDQSPVVDPVVINTVMMGADDSNESAKHAGIVFWSGSSSALLYTDISDGTYGAVLQQNAIATLDHVMFTDCDTGILGAGGRLTLNHSTFNHVSIPADWDFHGTFHHADTTFSNTDLNGWRYGGNVSDGEVARFDSTDGEYNAPYFSVDTGGSIMISPGVTIKMIDRQGWQINGTISAIGTADHPITFYGDGICGEHAAIINNTNGTATYEYVHFRNLCSGVRSSNNSTFTLSYDSFDTIAGPAVQMLEYSKLTADHLTLHDVYQAISLDHSQAALSDITVNLVNGYDAAVYAVNQSPVILTDSSIDTAGSCVEVSKNSSLNADKVTLTHCERAGIKTINDNVAITPSGITVTNSDISHSGMALELARGIAINISHNKFHDNTIGLYLVEMPDTTVINNWWGNDSGPTIADNPTGTGDSIVLINDATATYRPWTGMTPPPEHNPIIIVPGITGSTLTKDYGDKTELWPNIAKMILSPTDSFLSDLALLQAGTPSTVRPVKVGDIIRSVSSVDIFGGLINTLEQNGYTEGANLFVLPYDWRLSNTQNQSLLNGAIATALAKSGKDKVNIIAHSMGGLLTQEYVAQHPDAPIDHLFYVGVPHLGAPKAFKTLMYGDTMGFNFSAGPITIPFLSADRVKTISQNMPSVYELLPSQAYLDTISHYITDIVHPPASLALDAIKALMIAGGRNAKMFPFAQTLHDDIDHLTAPAFSTYDFAGCGITKTIGGFVMTRKQSLTSSGFQLLPEHRVAYTAGDDVVPVASATAAAGAVRYYLHAGTHSTLPSTSAVQNAIVDILNAKNIDNDASISSDIHACALSGDIVEVHSPVTLDIYDDAHHHTGPTSTGDIEYGIPNADYETIGDEKFVFLPSGPTYTIVNHAQAAGAYDLYISHSDDNDAITSQTYFSNVPITATSTGMFTISPATHDYVISMDDNGDGTEDRSIAPSSVLDQADAADTTPPVTTAAITDDGTVTLSAHDDLSGILNTKYSIDNVTWNIYTAPFQIVKGTTLQYVSLDRAGNTEDIQHMVFATDSTSSPQVPSGQAASPQTSQTVINNITIVSPAPTPTVTDTVSDETDSSDIDISNEPTADSATVDDIPTADDQPQDTDKPVQPDDKDDSQPAPEDTAVPENNDTASTDSNHTKRSSLQKLLSIPLLASVLDSADGRISIVWPAIAIFFIMVCVIFIKRRR